MKIVWELDVADANVVLEGLGELPTKKSGPLAVHLKRVADQQVAAQLGKQTGVAGEAPKPDNSLPPAEPPSPAPIPPDPVA